MRRPDPFVPVYVAAPERACDRHENRWIAQHHDSAVDPGAADRVIEVGVLMSYGQNITDRYRLAAPT